jgi:hypothetical protein
MPVVDKYIIDVRTQGTKSSKKALGRVDSATKSMAKSVASLGLAYLSAQGLISGVKASIDAFAKQELAQKKLSTALGFTSNALLEQARALQQVSMFGDEDIIMMQSMLAAFVKGEDEIKQLTVATLDLASGMGIDLKNAGDLIAKTIGSSTNALSRYGIQVEGAVGSSERLETLTGNIANLFGGQAKAQTETMTGSLEQMKNAIGDTAEAIGEVLSPIVIDIANTLKTMAEQFENIISLSLAEEFNKEASELSVLFRIAQDVTTDLEVRSEALKKINDNYSDYLPNLLNEKSNLDEIKNAHDNITFALLKRLELETKEAELRELMKDRSSLKQSINDYQSLKQQLLDTGNIVEQNIFGQISYTGANQDAIAALESYDTAIKLANEGLSENKDNLIASTQSASEMSKIFNSLTTDKEKFGITSKTVSKDVEKGTKDLAKEEQLYYASSLSGLRGMIKGKIQAYSAEMFAGLLSKEIASKGLVGVLTASAGAIAAGALFESVVPQFEQGGLIGGRRHSQGGTTIEAEKGEFIMSRNAVSSVGLENLNRMNQGGGSSSSISININGGMISPDFVENELAEAIREATRKGADFGIS